ncbi:MAG TPA: hypothetical protein VFG23_19160 [Polyangia bacterium]|nr:hypothetical protein [Polyangia bacterium]
MCERIDARSLRTGCGCLLLRVDRRDMREWGVQRRGRRGLVLHERMYEWRDTVYVEWESTNVRSRRKWLRGADYRRLLYWFGL